MLFDTGQLRPDADRVSLAADPSLLGADLPIQDDRAANKNSAHESNEQFVFIAPAASARRCRERRRGVQETVAELTAQRSTASMHRCPE